MADKETSGAGRLLKLLVGAGGIYMSFIMYGQLQEQIFKFRPAAGNAYEGQKFSGVFSLQAVGESLGKLRSLLLRLVALAKSRGLVCKERSNSAP